MRSMQRLSHLQRPDETAVKRIHGAERRKVSSREHRVWARRLQFGFRIVSVLGLCVVLGYWLWGGGFVAEALVQANLVVARAPATVRVAEVLVRPGMRTVRGTPLMRLESTAAPELRRPFELAVIERDLRLQLIESGGDLGDVDLSRRADRVAEAEREMAQAQADRAVAEAALERSLRARAALDFELRSRAAQNQGLPEALEARSQEAVAQVARAHERGDYNAFDAESRVALNSAGIVSDLATADALAERDASEREIEGLDAAARALQRETRAAREVSELDDSQALAALAEMDARIVEEQARVASAEQRRQQWQQLALSRRELGAGGTPQEIAGLRALELEIARNDLAAARARLAECDAQTGSGLLRAWTEGVIERVFVEHGAVVEADEPLVRYFDPHRLTVTAYLDPADARRPIVGQPCRILQLDGSLRLAGRVVSIDAALVPCPETLPRSSRGPTDMRLPVHIECDLFDQRALLQPNLRVRVSFTDGENTQAARLGP